ncbi:unnamed protein product [Acidocella sp. C78]|nr:unnamed protein product [Acidocella sp. C78]
MDMDFRSRPTAAATSRPASGGGRIFAPARNAAIGLKRPAGAPSRGGMNEELSR